MKRLVISLCVILSVFSACDKIDLGEDVPACIDKLLNKADGTVREIWRYQYKGESVYLFYPTCCDRFTDAYYSNCEKICSPSGGLTGIGDGLCPQFFNEITEGRLIWRRRE